MAGLGSCALPSWRLKGRGVPRTKESGQVSQPAMPGSRTWATEPFGGGFIDDLPCKTIDDGPGKGHIF